MLPKTQPMEIVLKSLSLHPHPHHPLIPVYVLISCMSIVTVRLAQQACHPTKFDVMRWCRMTIILDRIVILRALIYTKQVGCLATRISACVQEDEFSWLLLRLFLNLINVVTEIVQCWGQNILMLTIGTYLGFT